MYTITAAVLAPTSLSRPRTLPVSGSAPRSCTHLAGGPRACHSASLGSTFGLAKSNSRRGRPQRLVTSAYWKQWIDFTAVPAW
eukprot:8383382-Pyramimonas_sp.AAC.1